MNEDLKQLRFSYENRLFGELRDAFGNQLGISNRDNRVLFDARKRELLGDAVQITSDLLPDVHAAYLACLRLIGSDLVGDLYVQQSPDYNANVLGQGNRFDLLIYSGLMRDFSLDELRFVIGHELGHVLFEHSGISVHGILERTKDLNEEQANLLFRWSRAAEISADRIGLLCCGKLGPAITALFKTSSGLMDLDEQRILQSFHHQYDILVKHLEQVGNADGWVRTHPMIHVRFKAIELAALDVVALRADPASFSWSGYRRIDQEIGRLLELLEDCRSPQRGLSSEDGQICTMVAMLYLALADPPIAWQERAFLHDLHRALGVQFSITGFLEEASNAVDAFNAHTLEELGGKRPALADEDVEILLKLGALMLSQASANPKTVAALEEISRALGGDPTRISGLIDRARNNEYTFQQLVES